MFIIHEAQKCSSQNDVSHHLLQHLGGIGRQVYAHMDTLNAHVFSLHMECTCKCFGRVLFFGLNTNCSHAMCTLNKPALFYVYIACWCMCLCACAKDGEDAQRLL